MNWKTMFFFLGVSWAASALCLGADGFVPLFDGETLAGWKPLPGGRWEVVDGAIVGSQEQTENRHGQLLSEKQYGNFVAHLKFKSLEGNSGFYFRVQEVDHVVAVKGFQAEIDAGGNSIGGLYETLGRAWVVQPTPETVGKYYKAKQWNEMTVTAVDGDITVEINGIKAAQLKDDPGARRGFFGLQLHGGQKMHVMFKDIEIKQLDVGVTPVLTETNGDSSLAEENRKVSPFASIQPELVKDLLWVWGNPGMAVPGGHTIASFAQASPAQRAKMLGVLNVIMAGRGLPDRDEQAEAEIQEVLGFNRLVWEISEGEKPWVNEQTMNRVRLQVKNHPQVEAVLLDDLSTVKIQKGFKPEHIRQIRRSLNQSESAIDIWGVWYTMSFDQEGIDAYISQLDVINLWTWHARDIKNLEQNVAHCEKLYPHKPIILGLYLYDYGGGRKMPRSLLEEQCETALKLTHAGRIEGIVFLTINNDEDTIRWTADWIQRVGGQQLGSPTVQGQIAPKVNASVAESSKLVSSDSAFFTVDDERKQQELKIGDGANWNYSGESWTESVEGIIQPPDKRNLHSRAFYTKKEYQDFTAEFEFNGDYRETGSGGAGLSFRATDSNHFYSIYFPWGGQQLRAKHFWASLIKVDGDGYLRSLKSTWVPGVPSETDRWYKVRIEVKGSSMNVWVDGRRALSVTDSSFQKGALGLIGYGWYAFRNIRINGESSPLSNWDNNQKIPVHNFTVGLDSQNMPSGCKAPNGDILIASGNQLVRSRDKGQTWEKPEPLPEEKIGAITDYGNTMFCTSDGRLIVQMWNSREKSKMSTPGIFIAESKDNGKTWSEPVASKVASGWPEIPKTLTCYGPLLETEDGVLQRFLLGGTKEDTVFPDVRTWGAVHVKAYAIRSNDGGKSWSAPIELDRPSWYREPRGKFTGSLDFTEPTGVAIGNRVTVLIRPVYSPFMWQCWSEDSGTNWDAASRATFPGYAQSMIRTQSGVIVCAHRYPHYSINLSYDDGLNWDEGTVIDYAFWAMGCIIEVEPDVVLCTYMNAQRDMPLLAQLVRITPNGPQPK